MNFLSLISLSLISWLLVACSDQPAQQPSEASSYTQKHNQTVSKTLPFKLQDDFEQSDRGFIATIDPLIIKNDRGEVIWNTADYQFMSGGAPDTVNPSLWRQAQLNNKHGLYQLADRIYQIRGFDLANMTIIEGDSGWIIIDPLTSKETAQVAMALINRELGERKVSAILFTHSHIDHFGGVHGILSPQELKEQNVQLIAPEGFMEEATSENIIAGMAMGRRANYMYGKQLPRSTIGHVGSGLGKSPAFGTFTIVPPNDLVKKTGEQRIIDGVTFDFQIVSGSEAPSEFVFFLPELKAFCGAELVSRNMHNLYTLRGAKIRDALAWSSHIDNAVGEVVNTDVDLYFGSHHWPIWGQKEITKFLKTQRDTYKYIHDQTVRLMNRGHTPDEIAETLQLPDSLQQDFSNRGYYGTLKHNSRAVYQFYLGWYDANPAHLDPLPNVQVAEKYIEMMGGADQVLIKSEEYYQQGEYRWLAELLNHLVFAEPNNYKAKELLAKTYQQLAYQAESGPWRDVYLSAAYELQNGTDEQGIDIKTMSKILGHTDVSELFKSMAVNLDPKKVNNKQAELNIVFTDLNEVFELKIENSVLHAKQVEKAQLETQLSLTKDIFVKLLTKDVEIAGLVGGEISYEGSLLDLASFFSSFDAADGKFNIVTP